MEAHVLKGLINL